MASLNTDMLAELKDIMEDDFAILVDTFVSDTDKRIDVFESSMDMADADVLRKAAHGLKGSSSNIGAERLSKLSADLEVAAKEMAFHIAIDLIEDVKQEYHLVRAALLELK